VTPRVRIGPPFIRVEEHELRIRVGRVEAGPQRRQLHNLAEVVLRCGGRREGAPGRRLHGGGLGGGGLNVAGGVGGGARQRGGEFGEVQDGRGALYGERRHVVRTRRHLGGGEGAEPDAVLLPRLADFRHPFSPRAHSDSSVHRMLVVVTIAIVVVVSTSFLGSGRRG